MKNGIFIGSFNPPTKAHFEISHLLYKNNYVNQIVFVPVNSNKKELIDLDKRIEMLDIYTKKYDYLSVSRIMKDSNASFNYRILNKLSNDYENISIIMGSDLLEKFNSFDNYQQMLEKYHFIIISRFNIDSLSLIKKYYQDYIDKFTIINYRNDFSSSLVREKIRNKETIKPIVEDEIIEYLIKNNVYKNL